MYLGVLASVKFYNIMNTDYNDLSNYNQQCDTTFPLKNIATPNQKNAHYFIRTERIGQEPDDPAIGFSETEKTQENYVIETKVGKSILGIAPVVITASALYNLAGKNHNITGNEIGDNEFLGHTQESGNIFFDGTKNYISY
ncbi:PIR Superfamily Protein [Plasmodium ovale curtisi]|uniref:PIR Superfamily Protein n=1 Tax=Plasmodium ovale curtisi TaxID=864141 RepID=A0A1A8WFJ6_PLAOA|nr:PIR Superfamily Protein [Plasmodium ovale curtisi]